MKADKRILIGAVIAAIVGLGLMQFWPMQLTNPPVVSTPTLGSAAAQDIAERACYDCHSNETVWPWYAHIVPSGLLLEKDVHEGRAVLNFSEWEVTCCTMTQIDEMATTVNTGEMPPPYYIILHPEADLNDEERGQLVNGLIAAMNEEIEN